MWAVFQGSGRFARAAEKDTKDTKERFDFDKFKEDFKQHVEDALKKKIQEAEEEYDEWVKILDEKGANLTSSVDEAKQQLNEQLEAQKKKFEANRDRLNKQVDEWKEKKEQQKAEGQKKKEEERAEKHKKKEEKDRKRKEFFDEWKSGLQDKIDNKIADAVSFRYDIIWFCRRLRYGWRSGLEMS